MGESSLGKSERGAHCWLGLEVWNELREGARSQGGAVEGVCP